MLPLIWFCRLRPARESRLRRLVVWPMSRSSEKRTVLVIRRSDVGPRGDRRISSMREKGGIGMSRYVGMDLGIGTRHRVAVLDGSERRGKPFAIEVSREGFEELLRRATEGA